MERMLMSPDQRSLHKTHLYRTEMGVIEENAYAPYKVEPRFKDSEKVIAMKSKFNNV